MMLIGLADVHDHILGLEPLEKVLKAADGVFLVGDITHFGHAGQIERVVRSVRRYTDKLWGVHGNCDYPDAEAYMVRHGLSLHAHSQIIGGHGVIGVGGSLYTPFGTPNEYSESQIRHFLNTAISGVPKTLPLILVSHQPPADTGCDRLRSGKHVGSAAVREFIEHHQPRICFSGHIHEASTVDRIGQTKIINPGPFGRGRYAYVEIGEGEVFAEIRAVR